MRRRLLVAAAVCLLAVCLALAACIGRTRDVVTGKWRNTTPAEDAELGGWLGSLTGPQGVAIGSALCVFIGGVVRKVEKGRHDRKLAAERETAAVSREKIAALTSRIHDHEAFTPTEQRRRARDRALTPATHIITPNETPR